MRAANQGARTCLIQENRLGGNGLQSGFACLRRILNLPEFSKNTSSPNSIEIGKLSTQVEEAEQELAQHLGNTLKGKKVTILQGTGVLVDETHVSVESAQGGETVQAKSIILAPGSNPTALPTLPFDGLDIIPGDDLLQLPAVPDQVMVAGGSAAACEIASLLNRLGSKVFLCSEDARLFPDNDRETGDTLEKAFKTKKIKLLLGKKPASFFKNNGKIDVTLEGGVKFSVNSIVWAGKTRKARTEALGAAESRIQLGGQGEVLVNEKMGTSLPGVYAIGGVTGRGPSPALADEEAKVAVGNALGKSRTLERHKTPFIVYSEPEFASVGCSADTAHYQGYRAVEGCCPADQLGLPPTDVGGPEIYKIVVEKSSKKVIGGHILSPRASEIIAPVLLAVKKGLTAADLAGLPHGTGSQGIREAARSAVLALKIGR